MTLVQTGMQKEVETTIELAGTKLIIEEVEKVTNGNIINIHYSNTDRLVELLTMLKTNKGLIPIDLLLIDDIIEQLQYV